MNPIRTRFAPSPTGALHVGTVRTALFAWLLAQKNGQFLLRIEDTDQKREVEGGINNIKETLTWLGLTWNEGPDIDGPYAPYIQSQRLDIYKKFAQELYEQGLAYADPYTPEEMDAFRKQAQAEKRPFLYRDHRPENPPAWDGTRPLRIRLEPKTHSWDDVVMGTITMGPEMIDDFIIMKSDGFPTYNFCHIIDDHLMGITHVLRSQEFLSSIPKFLGAHEVLGWKPPLNATTPPVLDETGKRKLSKRFGAKPILEYRNEGYLPEALINFMASLGWNDGTEQEIFSRQELIEKFSLERVQRSGARFDDQRLDWMNGYYIRNISLDDLYDRSKSFWGKESEQASDDYKKSVLALIQERLKYLAEIPELTTFFFIDLPINIELIDKNKQLKKFEHAELRTLLEQARGVIANAEFTVQSLTEQLNTLLETTGQKPGVLFSLIRISTTQAPSSPGLADTLVVLGKETALRRIDATLAAL